MLYNNYEFAHELFASADFFVTRTLGYLARSMLAEANVRMRPLKPFDMRLFYVTTVQCLAAHFDYSLDEKYEETSPGVLFNFPDLRSPDWSSRYFVSSGLYEKFERILQNKPRTMDGHFDVGFAVEIASNAFSNPEIIDTIGLGRDKLMPPTEFWT